MPPEALPESTRLGGRIDCSCLVGGRYWDRTSDLPGVNGVLYPGVAYLLKWRRAFRACGASRTVGCHPESIRLIEELPERQTVRPKDRTSVLGQVVAEAFLAPGMWVLTKCLSYIFAIANGAKFIQVAYAGAA
jgi:hypothetical protein